MVVVNGMVEVEGLRPVVAQLFQPRQFRKGSTCRFLIYQYPRHRIKELTILSTIICLGSEHIHAYSPFDTGRAMSSESERSPVLQDLSERFIPGAFPDPLDSVLTTQQTLTQSIFARRDEYTEPRKIKIKIGSWNVGNHSCARDIASWFSQGKGVDPSFSKLSLSSKKKDKAEKSDIDESVKDQEARQSSLSKNEPTIPKDDSGSLPAGEEIGLYVLGLQEIVDVGSPAEALRPYTDPSTANIYKEALEESMPPGYIPVAEQQLVGLLILIYASPTVAEDVRSSTTTSVGTGLMGYMGNKGAVTAHIILGEATRLLFINSHLAAGADKTSLERRNWDANSILTRTRFEKVDDPSGVPSVTGESIGDEDVAFWFGDLNYRLEIIPGDDVRRLLSFHVGNEHDLKLSLERITGKKETEESDADGAISSKSDSVSVSSEATKSSKKEEVHEIPEDIDPASVQTTLSSLLPHDELMQQMKSRRAFHEGWKEGPIRFLPTYKYDVGTVAIFDSSEKKRSPSWCDRILYRTRDDYEAYKQSVFDEEEARKKDEEMKARGIEEDENVIFDYNPEEDGEELYDPDDPTTEDVTTRDGQHDEMLLEYYASHQRVLSSDHKPLVAIFSLTYQAVVPEKKSKIHAEVARELDRRENEGRPIVTIVIDKPAGRTADGTSDDPSSRDVIDFGPVRYKKAKHVNATVANTGQVPATLSLVERPVSGLGEEGPTPPWLTVRFDRDPDQKEKKSKNTEPPSYTLEPGDTCNIEFVAMVDSHQLAHDLNDDVIKLDDVLILRVQNGRDHFLPMSGRWQRSSLDRSIDKIKHIPEEGMRKLQQQKLTGSPKSGFFSTFRGSEG
jgi:inositol polyphosphate 5-phosphatase INPP5B/F